MKKAIHPKWFPNAKIICACGNVFETGSVQEEMHVDICYSCHPFYTGQMKFVDTAGRVDAFKAKMAKAVKTVSKSEKRKLKREKRIQEELSRPDTLEALRSSKN